MLDQILFGVSYFVTSTSKNNLSLNGTWRTDRGEGDADEGITLFFHRDNTGRRRYVSGVKCGIHHIHLCYAEEYRHVGQHCRFCYFSFDWIPFAMNSCIAKDNQHRKIQDYQFLTICRKYSVLIIYVSQCYTNPLNLGSNQAA